MHVEVLMDAIKNTGHSSKRANGDKRIAALLSSRVGEFRAMRSQIFP
jgi:hypothetical protein